MPVHAQRMSSLLASDKEFAYLNMLPMSVALDVSKLRGWLKAFASRNMRSMVVTLDVSKLSGWLKAVALCRVESGGHTMWSQRYCTGREAGTRGAAPAEAACIGTEG